MYKKITEKFLGTITEKGLIKPKVDRLVIGYNNISVKEYGAFNLVYSQNLDIIRNTKENTNSYR